MAPGWLLLAIGILLIPQLTLSSCVTDADCLNGGNCDAGKCECAERYIGRNCESQYTAFFPSFVAYIVIFCILWTGLFLVVLVRMARIWQRREKARASDLFEQYASNQRLLILSLEIGFVSCRLVDTLEPLPKSMGYIPETARGFLEGLGNAVELAAFAYFVRLFLEIHARYSPGTRPYITALNIGIPVYCLLEVFAVTISAAVPGIANGAFDTLALVLGGAAFALLVALCIVFMRNVLRSALSMATPGSPYHHSTLRLYRLMIACFVFGPIITVMTVIFDQVDPDPGVPDQLCYYAAFRGLEIVGAVGLIYAVDPGNARATNASGSAPPTPAGVAPTPGKPPSVTVAFASQQHSQPSVIRLPPTTAWAGPGESRRRSQEDAVLTIPQPSPAAAGQPSHDG